MNKYQSNISFCFCDFKNSEHCENLIKLLNHYMEDPMGDSPTLNYELGQRLIQGLSSHPSCFVLFIKYNNEFAGLATCFVNFSTFKAKPYINLHDIIILKELRGKGIGKRLLEEIIEIAKKRDYCKITLEVREDNVNAMKLYADLGFMDTIPLMHFWTKNI